MLKCLRYATHAQEQSWNNKGSRLKVRYMTNHVSGRGIWSAGDVHQIHPVNVQMATLPQHSTRSWNTRLYTAWFTSIPDQKKSTPNKLKTRPTISHRVRPIWNRPVELKVIVQKCQVNSWLLLVLKRNIHSSHCDASMCRRWHWRQCLLG